MTKQTKKVQDDTQIKTSKVCDVFKLVKDPSGQIVIVAGNYAVTDKRFKTFQDAEEYLETKPYDVILNTCLIMLNIIKNENVTNDNKETDKVSEDNK